MLFNFNNWNNSGKKEYDSKKKEKKKLYPQFSVNF